MSQLQLFQDVYVVGAAIVQNGRCLVTRRSSQMSAPLMWEFPGGKLKRHETPEVALCREVFEELNITIKIDKHIGAGKGQIGTQRIHLDVYGALWISGILKLIEHQEYGWFLPQELDKLDWPEADRPILQPAFNDQRPSGA